MTRGPETSASDISASAPATESVDGEHAESLAAKMQFVAGNPSALEIAATTAVLVAVLEELSGHQEMESAPVQSAWDRNSRAIRMPLHPAAGAWRSFSG